VSGATSWARNDIRRGWTSLVIVALLVAIAGGAVMAGAAGARRAGQSVDRFLADTGSWDVSMFSGGPLDAELRAELMADSRISAVGDVRVMLATPTSLLPGLGGTTFVVPDEYWGDLFRPRLVEGAYPSGPDEIGVTEWTAAELGLEVGQAVDMWLLTSAGRDTFFTTGEFLPEDAGTVTVTAILRLPDDLQPGAFASALFIAPAAFLEARGGDPVATGHKTDIYLTPGTVIDDVVNEYSLKVDGADVRSQNSEISGARRAADLQRGALLIGTAIAAVAGLLIAGQGFGRFLSRRSSDTATLAALGMPSGQRTMAGWMPGLAAAALGAVLAVPIAIALSPLFPLRAARRADPDVGVNVDLQVLIVGALIIFAIGAGAALLSATLWSRTTRSDGADTTVSVVTQMAVRLRLRPEPTMGSGFALQRGRGARRTPVLPALAGSVAAIAVIVGALVLAASLDGLLTSPARYGAPWDLQVGVPEKPEKARTLTTRDDRVDAATVASSGALDISVNGSLPIRVFAVGIDPLKGSLEPVILEGRVPGGPDEVLVGSATLDRLDLDVGDPIAVSGTGDELPMTVVGRAIVPIVGSDLTDDGIVLPLDAFRSLGAKDLVDRSETVILTRLVEGAEVEGFRTELEDAGLFVDGTFRQASVTVLDEVRGIPFYVAFFTAFIGALAVFHSLVVTARRRRRDLAVMRAVGCYPRQTGAVIHWQGFFLAMAAIALGVPIGLIGGRLLWNSIANGTNVLIVSETPWVVIGLVAASAVLGAAVVLAAVPAWSARRRPPGADLRTE
jgi:hypothetical protein